MRTENTGATVAERNPGDTAETRQDVTTAADQATAGTDTDRRRERPTGPVWDALTANPGLDRPGKAGGRFAWFSAGQRCRPM
jgi:hypothetical protein